jgi:hypothetical protein
MSSKNSEIVLVKFSELTSFLQTVLFYTQHVKTCPFVFTVSHNITYQKGSVVLCYFMSNESKTKVYMQKTLRIFIFCFLNREFL